MNARYQSLQQRGMVATLALTVETCDTWRLKCASQKLSNRYCCCPTQYPLLSSWRTRATAIMAASNTQKHTKETSSQHPQSDSKPLTRHRPINNSKRYLLRHRLHRQKRTHLFAEPSRMRPILAHPRVQPEQLETSMAKSYKISFLYWGSFLTSGPPSLSMRPLRAYTCTDGRQPTLSSCQAVVMGVTCLAVAFYGSFPASLPSRFCLA